MGMIREVWSRNLQEELSMLDHCLTEFPVVSMDTEFPGLIMTTQMNACETEVFCALTSNTKYMNMFQLGLTLSNDNGCIAGTWEFNFKDFEVNDVKANIAVHLSRKKNFNFNKIRRDGIASQEFAAHFLPICRSGRISKWVTFHGVYDIAYLLKALLNIERIPASIETFTAFARSVFGTVSDIKYMACYCDGLMNGKLGLQKLAYLLNVTRTGLAHHAGSDSLLTAAVYETMKKCFELSADECDGFLYGLNCRIQAIHLLKN